MRRWALLMQYELARTTLLLYLYIKRNSKMSFEKENAQKFSFPKQ